MNEEYKFINKMKIDNKSVQREIITKFFVALICIVILIISSIMALLPVGATIVVFLLLISRGFSKRGIAVINEDISTIFQIRENSIYVKYADIDRYDGKDKRTEEYLINVSTMQDVDYKKEYYRLKLRGAGNERITYGNQVVDNSNWKSNDNITLRLYLTEDVREDILYEVKKLCDGNMVKK